jgi:hypothetical protein
MYFISNLRLKNLQLRQLNDMAWAIGYISHRGRDISFHTASIPALGHTLPMQYVYHGVVSQEVKQPG